MDRIQHIRELIRNLQKLIDGHVECLPFDIIISISLMAAGFSGYTSLSFFQYIRTRKFVIGLGTQACYNQFVEQYLPTDLNKRDIGLLCAYNIEVKTKLNSVLKLNTMKNQEVIYLLIPNTPEDTASDWTTSLGNIILKQSGKLHPSTIAMLRSDFAMIRAHIVERCTRNLHIETLGIHLNNKYIPIMAVRDEPLEIINVHLPRSNRLNEISQRVSYHWLTCC